MRHYVFENFDVARLRTEAGKLARVFSETGLLVFPGLLKEDKLFRSYVADFHRAIDMLISEAGLEGMPDFPIDEKLTHLAAVAAPLGKFLADLGTQPAKLITANLIKFRPEFVAISRAIFGEDALLATPAAGDTLHLFAPSDNFFRYNLPVHQ